MQWILLNGLREIFEGFEQVLDTIYPWTLQIQIIEGKITQDLYKQKLKAFTRTGVGSKLDMLSKEVSIQNAGVEKIKSIAKARNCITHRRGIVGDDDCDKNTGEMAINWDYWRVFARHSNGVEENDIFGKLLPEGTEVYTQLCIKEKYFKRGDYLDFSTLELNELIFTIRTEGLKIMSDIQNSISQSANVVVQN